MKHVKPLFDPGIWDKLKEEYRASLQVAPLRIEKMQEEAVYNLDVIDFLALAPGNSVDLMIVDDDYAAETTRWNPHAKDQHPSQFDWETLEVPTFLGKPWVHHASRVLKAGGILVAFGFPNFATAFQATVEDADLRWRSHLAWFKTNAAPHKRRNAPNFASAYECIWIASKGKYSLNVQEGKVMMNWVMETTCLNCRAVYPVYLSKEWDHPKWFAGMGWEKVDYAPQEFIGPPFMDSLCPNCHSTHGVWLSSQVALDALLEKQYLGPFASERGRVHKAKKPEWLITKLMVALSRPGDLVVDPMCGQGTIGVVAQRLGRSFILNDLDPRWANYSRQSVSLQQTIDLYT